MNLDTLVPTSYHSPNLKYWVVDGVINDLNIVLGLPGTYIVWLNNYEYSNRLQLKPDSIPVGSVSIVSSLEDK